ncbi:hypothetical protein GGI07_004629 [Coemansia sp. Benny D115]|nr:hypothetical protein GGI07_004629 [Coemansia sp. Benny D115]
MHTRRLSAAVLLLALLLLAGSPDHAASATSIEPTHLYMRAKAHRFGEDPGSGDPGSGDPGSGDPGSGDGGGSMSTTFIDLLSSDERFSELLHTVQRLRMVLPMNRIRNATLFAPTNEAIRKYRKEVGQEPLGLSHIAGAVYRGIADYQAWYHLAGDGVIEPAELTKGTMLWESLSRLEAIEAIEGAAGSGGEKAAAGIMLKTEISSDERVLVNGIPVFGQQYRCTAGSLYLIDGLLTIPPSIKELLHSPKAAPPAKEGPLPPPPAVAPPRALDAGEGSTPGSPAGVPYLEDAGEYGFIERLLETAGWADALGLGSGSGSGGGEERRRPHTLWAFNNRVFAEAFNYAERYYLMYGPAFAKDDDDLYREAIEDSRDFTAAYVSDGAVSIARLGAGKHKIAGFGGRGKTTVVVEDGAPGGSLHGYVNGQPIDRADIVARNGIVHNVEKVVRPEGLVFTPQKVLVGLNATMFVRLFKDCGLGEYIDGTNPDRKVTLLVPTNRAMEDAFGYELGDDDDDDDTGVESAALPNAKSPRERQREWALYHIVDGQKSVDDLVHSPLLRTKLATEWTQGKPQVVKAQVDQALSGLAKHVSFNGADNILPEPLVVGGATIYLLSSPMPTPPSMINALIQNLDLSLFVAAMGASHIVDEVQRENGITVLAPVTSSFTAMGLVWAYLSLPGDLDARADLSRLVKSHILATPVYSDEVPMHSDSSAKTLIVDTLNGNKVGLYRTPHGMFVVAEDNAELLKLSDRGQIVYGKQMDTVQGRLESIADSSSGLRVSETDVLLRTGVGHVLDRGLILPANDPQSKDSAAGGSSDGDGAPGDGNGGDGDGDGGDGDGDGDGDGIAGYSLLVPSDKSWRENPAYRELVRRDHDEMALVQDDADNENPWRNATTSDITHYLNMLVRLHIIPIANAPSIRRAREEGQRGLPESKLLLADRRTYPTMLDSVKLRAHEFATDRFSIQLDRMPFYQSPGGVPFISFATVVRSGYGRSGAVFELDAALRLPPDESGGPGGWKQFAWNAAVWLTGIGMGSGLLGVSGYWVRQWWTRADYQSL